jgi:hypothetical protein
MVHGGGLVDFRAGGGGDHLVVAQDDPVLVTRAAGEQAKEQGEQGEISYHVADSARVRTNFKPGDKRSKPLDRFLLLRLSAINSS